ncbi:MAG TPA: DUF1611 domain-containing protein [Longimicrobiaceae bacterium]|jgi:uncharacterized NAD-dependent epimerase/dehydratase family protein|nr:DUF1611 domain-containing protein [Longimicrobiaceae bacterium]
MDETQAALKGYRYLVLAEGAFGPETSKTANSAIRYLPERVAAVIDSRYAGRTVEDVLGFGGEIPVVGSVADGLETRPTALLVGIAPQGGRLPEEWRPALREALAAGLSVVSGLHFHLSDDAELAALAADRDVRIHDLRKPPEGLPVSRGLAREVDALTVLTIGTDCNIGKMTAALQLRDALVARGVRTGFAATGQTGILIEGWGIAVDAVVADFIGGAAESLVLRAAKGNDVVLVEGQGSLVHPGYSGVTLGLLHGSMPDAMIVCHKPSRTFPYGGGGAYAWMRLPSLAETIALCEAAIAPLRPAKVIGICLNTSDLPEDEARAAVAMAVAETGLPATDPVRYDAGPLVEAIEGAMRG